MADAIDVMVMVAVVTSGIMFVILSGLCQTCKSASNAGIRISVGVFLQVSRSMKCVRRKR